MNKVGEDSVLQELEGCSVMLDSLQPHGLQPVRLLGSCNSPGKITGVGCHFLLQGILLTQGSCIAGVQELPLLEKTEVKTSLLIQDFNCNIRRVAESDTTESLSIYLLIYITRQKGRGMNISEGDFQSLERNNNLSEGKFQSPSGDS